MDQIREALAQQKIIAYRYLALNDDTLQPQTREYLEKIGGSAQHLLGLINDILDMSEESVV